MFSSFDQSAYGESVQSFLQFDLNIGSNPTVTAPARSLPTQVLWYSTVIEKLLLYCILFFKAHLIQEMTLKLLKS